MACQCKEDPGEGHLSSPELLHVAGVNAGISGIAKKQWTPFLCALNAAIPYASFKQLEGQL